MAVLARQRRLQPCHRRPLQGRLHHPPLRPARRRHPRGAARDVLVLLHGGRAALRHRSGAGGSPAAGPARPAAGDARLEGRCAETALLWAPRAWTPAAGASRSCSAPTPTAAGPRSRRASPRRRPARSCSTARCCRAWSNAHSHAFQRAFAGLAERRESAERRLLVVARPHVPRRPAPVAGAAARRRGPALRRAAARAATPRSASSTTCSTTSTAGPMPIRWRCRGRWPTRRPRPASA